MHISVEFFNHIALPTCDLKRCARSRRTLDELFVGFWFLLFSTSEYFSMLSGVTKILF